MLHKHFLVKLCELHHTMGFVTNAWSGEPEPFSAGGQD